MKLQLLSIDECAEILHVSRATFQRLIDSGQIPVITITAGRRKRLQRVDEDDLVEFVKVAKVRNKKTDRLQIARRGT